MKHRKGDSTKLRTKRLGATEDRVGDRTGPGAGYDLMSQEPKTKEVKKVKEVKRRRA